jgi:hypothetical protein
MKFLYKYPQAEFPYQRLIEENRNRSKLEREFELIDTGIFDDDRYFDVFVEYAKADVEDILIKITVANRGPEAAAINILPTVWLRNTWTWDGSEPTGRLKSIAEDVVELECEDYGKRWLHCERATELLFTENETNNDRLFGAENRSTFVKDGIGEFIIRGNTGAVNPAKMGTKAAANYCLDIPAGGEVIVRLRLSDKEFARKGAKAAKKNGFADFDDVFSERINEASEYYRGIIPADLSDGRNSFITMS